MKKLVIYLWGLILSLVKWVPFYLVVKNKDYYSHGRCILSHLFFFWMNLLAIWMQKKERDVNKSIRNLGITIVMIAHRQETIAMADRTIILSNRT